jgi:hypothetical protein
MIIVIVYLLFFLFQNFFVKFIDVVHKSEYDWYRLYIDVPKEHPLLTFDLFADLLCLLATLTYNHLDCQNQV